MTDLQLRLGASEPGSASQLSAESHHLSFHSQLQTQLGSHLPTSARRELESLGHEADAELFHEGLLNLAGRLESNNSDELALAIYQAQADELNGRSELDPIRARSVTRRDALMGSGDTGARAEVLARRFAREASNPSALIGMAGAQAVFGVTRMALLSRLAASPTASILTRGAGARLAASTGAYLLEAPSFTAFTRLANAGLGQSQDWSLRTVGHEVAASYITLGALRASGA
ncbi:MAG TPA: hypothetical protein VFW62_04265, partial [bacterium]|nr:hypothetical protein [bacterium]